MTLLMLAGLSLFVDIAWARFLPDPGAILAGGAGLRGLRRRDRRGRAGGPRRSLLAFMVSLPIAFLSLVPSGTVGVRLYDVI